MSTFTIQLNELLEDGYDLGMGKDDYPIFDETYRDLLNRKIFDHYAMYEIGLETESMFKFALNRRMREIMPYYNQLYMSEKIEFDPLSTMKFTETGVSSSDASGTAHVDTATESTSETDSTSESTNTTTGSSDSRSRSVNSTMPQVRLAGDEDYATAANDSVSDTNTTGDSEGTVAAHDATTGTGDTVTDSTTTDTASGTLNRDMQGYQGHAAELLMRYRDSLLNIDMQVIDNLSNLFMGVWDNGDEFASNGRIYYGRLHYPI